MDQPALFDVPDEYEQEWRGMPEFVQEAQEPFATLIVRFRNKADLEDFANRVEQPLTTRTQSIWFPALEWVDHASKAWVDES